MRQEAAFLTAPGYRWASRLLMGEGGRDLPGLPACQGQRTVGRDGRHVLESQGGQRLVSRPQSVLPCVNCWGDQEGGPALPPRRR